MHSSLPLFDVFYVLPAAAISNPFSNYRLFRNPRAKTEGKFLTLLDFLALSKNSSSLTGVLISIEVSICSAYVLLVA